MLGDIMKRVDAIVRDHADGHDKSIALPDSWVLTPTENVESLAFCTITMGDVRALVQRVRECESAVADERRAELVRVATAIYAQNIHVMKAEVAVNNASDLIDHCDGFLPDDE